MEFASNSGFLEAEAKFKKISSILNRNKKENVVAFRKHIIGQTTAADSWSIKNINNAINSFLNDTVDLQVLEKVKLPNPPERKGKKRFEVEVMFDLAFQNLEQIFFETLVIWNRHICNQTSTKLNIFIWFDNRRITGNLRGKDEVGVLLIPLGCAPHQILTYSPFCIYDHSESASALQELFKKTNIVQFVQKFNRKWISFPSQNLKRQIHIRLIQDWTALSLTVPSVRSAKAQTGSICPSCAKVKEKLRENDISTMFDYRLLNKDFEKPDWFPFSGEDIVYDNEHGLANLYSQVVQLTLNDLYKIFAEANDKEALIFLNFVWQSAFDLHDKREKPKFTITTEDQVSAPISALKQFFRKIKDFKNDFKTLEDHLYFFLEDKEKEIDYREGPFYLTPTKYYILNQKDVIILSFTALHIWLDILFKFEIEDYEWICLIEARNVLVGWHHWMKASYNPTAHWMIYHSLVLCLEQDLIPSILNMEAAENINKIDKNQPRWNRGTSTSTYRNGFQDLIRNHEIRRALIWYEFDGCENLPESATKEIESCLNDKIREELKEYFQSELKMLREIGEDD